METSPSIRPTASAVSSRPKAPRSVGSTLGGLTPSLESKAARYTMTAILDARRSGFKAGGLIDPKVLRDGCVWNGETHTLQLYAAVCPPSLAVWCAR